MFSDVVMLHGGSVNTLSDSVGPPTCGERVNVCSSEKMTQTGDGNIWFATSTNRRSVSMQEQKVRYELSVQNVSNLPLVLIYIVQFHEHLIIYLTIVLFLNSCLLYFCELKQQLQTELGKGEAMTCQELLALSGALSAALPTGQSGRDSFVNSLAKGF